LVGQRDRILFTSESVRGSNDASGLADDLEKLGGGSEVVESRIVFTLDWKNSANLLATENCYCNYCWFLLKHMFSVVTTT